MVNRINRRVDLLNVLTQRNHIRPESTETMQKKKQYDRIICEPEDYNIYSSQELTNPNGGQTQRTRAKTGVRRK